jgi:hydroxymethylpyrimidine/phosphomethylpyrimidine kinase
MVLHLGLKPVKRPVSLSIAGSDSGGGAGIQADLITFARLGSLGTTVITCVTAQNLDGVTAIHPVPPADIAAQIDAIFLGFPVGGVKTGMLYSREIIDAVGAALEQNVITRLVVDPVMVATSGARLLNEDAIAGYAEKIFPWAYVMTPNLDEAAVLLGRPIRDAADMPDAARELGLAHQCAVLLKGGHLEGPQLVDVLWDRETIHRWTGARVTGVGTHGTGCMLSAALTARLSFGDPLVEACLRAREYVEHVLLNCTEISDGRRVPGLSVSESGPIRPRRVVE